MSVTLSHIKIDEVIVAEQEGLIDLHARIKVRGINKIREDKAKKRGRFKDKVILDEII